MAVCTSGLLPLWSTAYTAMLVMVAASESVYRVAHNEPSDDPLSEMPLLEFPKVPLLGAQGGVHAGLGVNVFMGVAVGIVVRVGVPVEVRVLVAIFVGVKVNVPVEEGVTVGVEEGVGVVVSVGITPQRALMTHTPPP